MSKYQNKKVTVDGITFDSKREANRYKELLLLERAGAISDLQRQVKYQLVPAQYRPVFDKKTRKWKERCVEREVNYIADFQYCEDGKLIVEDVKGVKTKDYILKRKMMLYFHGIQVKEI
jgi:hypothetical protein